MDRSPVKSSLLASVGYDEATETLEVEFRGKDGKPGRCYRYLNVGRVCAHEFLTAESVGQFFLRKVKPFYKCERLPHEAEATKDTQAEADAEATGSEATEKY